MDIDVGALKALVREKGLSLDLVVDSIEQSLLVAYHRTAGSSERARVELDRRTGHVVVWATEIGEDGSQCQWGDVLAWESPQRLVLAWRINMEWTFDPKLLTEIEITFTDVGNGETEVRLEHSKFENFGAGAEKALQVFDGWHTVLARYADAL